MDDDIKVKMSHTVTHGLKRRIQIYAEREGRSMSNAVDRLLTKALEQVEQEHPDE